LWQNHNFLGRRKITKNESTLLSALINAGTIIVGTVIIIIIIIIITVIILVALIYYNTTRG